MLLRARSHTVRRCWPSVSAPEYCRTERATAQQAGSCKNRYILYSCSKAVRCALILRWYVSSVAKHRRFRTRGSSTGIASQRAVVFLAIDFQCHKGDQNFKIFPGKSDKISKMLVVHFLCKSHV